MTASEIAPYIASGVVIDTHSAEQMEHALKSYWQATSFSTPDSSKNFRAIGRKHQLNRMGLSFCYHNSETEAHFNGIPFIRQQFALTSKATVKIGRKETVIDPKTSCVFSPGTELTLGFGAAYQQICVRVCQATLESLLTNLTGILPRGVLQFKTTPVSGARYEQLRRSLLFLADETSTPEASPLFVKELEDAFLVQFLLANDHNHQDLLCEIPKSATPKLVRLVEEFIIANWEKAMTVQDIAQVAGVSARSIYTAFQQHRGYGPKTFLRQTRLNKAREFLQKSGMDVVSVSKICGFSNAGHFARYYRSAFGELPSHTMR